MRRCTSLWLPAILFLAALAVAARDAAAFRLDERKGEDFSAVEVHFTGRGETRTTVFMSGQMIRREDASGRVIIARLDKKVVWILDPREKTYFEAPLDPKKLPMLGTDAEEAVKRTQIGREKVAGFDCVKYEVSMDAPAMGKMPGPQGPRTLTSIVWIADRLGAAVKSETEGFRMELTDIKIGPQPAALFEPPQGFSKVESPMPGLMPGKMPGQAQGQMPGGMKLPPGVKLPDGVQIPPGMMPPGKE